MRTYLSFVSIFTNCFLILFVFFTNTKPLLSFVHPFTPCSSRFSVKKHSLYSIKLPSSNQSDQNDQAGQLDQNVQNDQNEQVDPGIQFIRSMGVSFTPKYVLINTDSSILIVNTSTKKIVFNFSTTDKVETYTFSHDNSKLVLVFLDKLTVVDLINHDSFDLDYPNVKSASFSQDGRHLALLEHKSSQIRVLSTSSFREKLSWFCYGADINIPVQITLHKVDFINNSTILLSVISKELFYPSTIVSLDINTGKFTVISKHFSSPVEIFTHPYRHKSYIYTAIDQNGTIITFDTARKTVLSTLHHISFNYQPNEHELLLKQSSDVFLSYFSKAKYLISGNKNKTIRIWLASSNTLVKEFISDNSVKAIAYSGEDLFIVTDDNQGFSLYVIKVTDLVNLDDSKPLGDFYLKEILSKKKGKNKR